MNQVPAIRLTDVVFRFQEKGKRNILDHVSLDIPQGKMTVIMGSSGCGKSTLAAVAAGLYPENGGYLLSGEISLYGSPLKSMNPQQRAKDLSLLFQNPDLQFCMDTPRKELYFCMENVCIPSEEMPQRAEEIAEQMGITALLDRKLTVLSGGEKQRVSLACLCVLGSRCIILDEAFANIDVFAAREILQHLKHIRESGTTIVAIDHQIDLWQDVADEVIILGEGGKVLCRENGFTDTLRQVCLEEGLFYPGEPEAKAAAASDDAAALSFEGVTIPKELIKKRFGKASFGESLLENVSVTFPRGKLTAVLGPSGSGKTTTFLSVLQKHTYQGRILLNGADVSKMKRKDLYQQIGIVFQNPANQFITQKVEEEVSSSLRLWKKDTSEAAVQNALEAYGLYRFRRYSPYMLSQGQQRRLAVLSVLSGGQKLLLLDEPTYGQDYRSTKAIMEQLRQKVEEEELTVIFITHDRKLARKWADRIYVLENRNLLEVEGGSL